MGESLDVFVSPLIEYCLDRGGYVAADGTCIVAAGSVEEAEKVLSDPMLIDALSRSFGVHRNFGRVAVRAPATMIEIERPPSRSEELSAVVRMDVGTLKGVAELCRHLVRWRSTLRDYLRYHGLDESLIDSVASSITEAQVATAVEALDASTTLTDFLEQELGIDSRSTEITVASIGGKIVLELRLRSRDAVVKALTGLRKLMRLRSVAIEEIAAHAAASIVEKLLIAREHA